MKRVGFWAIGIGLVVTMGLLTMEQGYAAEKDHARECTLATLKGRYLFGATATLLPPAFGVTQQSFASTAGYHIFNGDGTGTDIVTFRINGETVLENEVAPLSYTVNADCTGSYTTQVPQGPSPSFGLFIAPDGESIAIITTGPDGNQASDISWRVSRK